MALENKRIGFALTGSFCTFATALECIEEIMRQGAEVTPIISHSVDTIDTRFGRAADLKEKLEWITGKQIIRTIPGAEPIGPKQLFDLLVVLPATGNTIAKLANGITDTPVTMAVKSHLRNNGPVVLGISTNDALGNGAKNIGALLNTRHFYFVPYGQDDPAQKNYSIIFNKEKVLPTLECALEGRQVQPLLDTKVER